MTPSALQIQRAAEIMRGGQWHGDEYRWWLTPSGGTPTIQVIEKPSESYEAYHQRKKREEEHEPRKVPFGFSRVLAEEGDGE